MLRSLVGSEMCIRDSTRMSSFKHKRHDQQQQQVPPQSPRSAPLKSPRSRAPSHKGPAPPPPLPPTRSVSAENTPRRPDDNVLPHRAHSEREPYTPHREISDEIKQLNAGQRFSSEQENNTLPQRSMTLNAQMVGRRSMKGQTTEVSENPESPRVRAQSAGAAQNDFTKSLKQV